MLRINDHICVCTSFTEVLLKSVVKHQSTFLTMLLSVKVCVFKLLSVTSLQRHSVFQQYGSVKTCISVLCHTHHIYTLFIWQIYCPLSHTVKASSLAKKESRSSPLPEYLDWINQKMLLHEDNFLYSNISKHFSRSGSLSPLSSADLTVYLHGLVIW